MITKVKHIIVATLATVFSIFNVFAEVPYFSERLPLYASSSKLANGKWVKVCVKKNGVYKLTFDQLKSYGFKHPDKVRVFGYGGALLTEELTKNYNDDLPEIYSYLGDNYILFYGVGPLKWSGRFYVQDKSEFPFAYSKNPYSDFGAYFLAEMDGDRLSMPDVESFDEEEGLSKFDVYSHYVPSIYLPEKVNVFNGGVAWYDIPLTPSGKKKISFPVANLVEGGESLFSLYHYVPDSNNQTYRLSFNCFGKSANIKSAYNEVVADVVHPANARTVDCTLDFSSSMATANSYLYYVMAASQSHSRMENGYLAFNNKQRGKNGLGNYYISNVSNETQVWKVDNPLKIEKVHPTLSNDTMCVKSQSSVFAEYVVLNPKTGRFLSVDSVVNVNNQNLHSSKGADLIILTPSAYVSQAEKLGNLHAEYEGISFLVVTPEQVFNEFSSGVADPTAIRAFMKMMYDRAVNDESYIKPKYLLLFGDGCYDNKGILRSGNTPARNLVLTYQYGSNSNSYVADDYYGMLADNSVKSFSLDTCVMHVSVGRLPFVNANQATQVVEKIGRYIKENNYGKWKMNNVILADDNEASQGALSGLSSSYHEFVNYAEMLSRVITKACPAAIQNKVYYDSYTRVSESSGYRYPAVENKIIENVNNGVMFINYIGHSNPVNWSAEKTFTQSQISGLRNNNLGVWFSASCDFSEYDNYNTSCGEALVLAPNGGAIAVVATSRSTYSSENNKIDTAFSRAFFSQKPGQSIGDLLKEAKNNVKQSIRVKYPLMGDPALRIHFPSMKVVTDSFSTDTFSAMSRIVVSGHIEDENQFIENFNGKINITVFDKLQKRSTKGNLLNLVTTYDDYVNVLYSGEAEVEEGKFSFTFLVPNDISYAYGSGRIAYYAYDKDNDFEAIGNTSDFVVGGSSSVDFADQNGPLVRAFINSQSFRSGDVVGDNPVFVAELHDENGINASGIGLGHDITISLNGADKISVNEYFVYNKNSYTDGKVVYPLADLQDGVYTIEFKSWDMLGNSSVSKLAFRVDKGKKPHIGNVMVVNNPAKENATISVAYDRLLTNVSYNVSIYSINGMLVKQMSGGDYCKEGELLLNWDLKDSNEQRVLPGVYVYKVDIKSNDGPYVSASEKIVVLPQ